MRARPPSPPGPGADPCGSQLAAKADGKPGAPSGYLGSEPGGHSWTALGIIAVVAMALRCAVVAWGSHHHVYGAITKDPAQYVHMARHLGPSYLDAHSRDFEAGLDRTPGYPLLLAFELFVTGGSVAGAMVIQSLVGAGVSAFTYLLGRELVSARVGLVAAAVVAVDPLSVAASGYPLTEEPFAFALVIGFWLWCRCLRRRSWRYAVAAGVVLGLAALVRPIGTYLILPVLLASWVALRGEARRILLSCCLVLSFALPVGGWLVRNLAVTGVPLVSTVEGYNMIHYRAAGALQYSDHISLPAAQKRLDERLSSQVKPGLNPAQYSRTEEHVGLDVVMSHPVGYTEAAAKSVERMLLGPGYPEVLSDISGPGRYATSPYGVHGIKVVTAVILVLFYLGALLGTLLLVHRRAFTALAVVAIPVVYLLLLSAGADGYSRMRAPMMPFAALLVGGAGLCLPTQGTRRLTLGRLLPLCRLRVDQNVDTSSTSSSVTLNP